jgi:hypothetical protein
LIELMLMQVFELHRALTRERDRSRRVEGGPERSSRSTVSDATQTPRGKKIALFIVVLIAF